MNHAMTFVTLNFKMVLNFQSNFFAWLMTKSFFFCFFFIFCICEAEVGLDPALQG